MLKAEKLFFYLLILFLPTQLGKHFWPDFSVISGIRVDYLSPTIYFTDSLIALLAIIYFIRLVRKSPRPELGAKAKVKKQNHNSKLKILTILLLFLILNILFSGHILNGFYHLIKLIEFSFVGFYIATQIKNLKSLQKIILLLAASAIGQSLLAIVQFVNQSSTDGLFYFLGERSFNSSTLGIANASINGELILRPYATFPHPNLLAGFLLCVMILSLGFFKIFKNNWQKILVFLCLLIGSGALILTMSRVAILLWIFIILFLFFKQSAFTGKWKKILIFVFFIVSLIITPFGTRLLSTHLTEESVVQREELISSSFKLFAQHPIDGVGFGNFLPYLPGVQKPLSPILYIQPVHNIFLLVLTETGIIGFSFFVWFLFKTYKHLLKKLKTHTVFLVLLTAFLIIGFFDHYFLTLQQGQLLFTVVLGLCWTSFAHRA